MAKNVVKTAHDARLSALSNKDDSLAKQEDENFQNMRRRLADRDHKQNRSRVTEIWMWVDRNAREIDHELKAVQEDLVEQNPFQK